MKHDIPPHVDNSALDHLISERVRREEHRAMLRDKWFSGLSFYQIAEKYNYSLTQTKNIIYKIGDPLLIEAARLK